MNYILYISIGIIIGICLIEIIRTCLVYPSSARDLLYDHIGSIARQASRYSLASEQDENAMIAVLHAIYGAGSLNDLELICTPMQFELATGINFEQFRRKILENQDKATRKMISVCPNYAPSANILARIAGEGV